MARSELWLVAGALLAVVVPAAALHAAAGDDRHAAGLTAAPFAWPRVLVAHLVFALPLGMLLAARLRTHPAFAVKGAPAAAGVVVAVVAVVVGPTLGDVIADAGVGPVPALVLRTGLAVALVLPWCLFGTASVADLPGRWAVTVGVLVAVVPPGVYAEVVAERRTATADEWVSTGRLAKADGVLTGLCELGSDRAVTGKPPQEIRREVRAQVARLKKAAGHPLSPGAPPAARFARAEVLVQLDRLDEAADLLRPLAANSPVATLLLAAVCRDREQWAESDAAFASALDRLLPRAAADPDAREKCRGALEGLAYNARMDRRPADAERALRRGLEELPADAARFHYLLGRHYHDGGRPALALDHLRAAADLDPAAYRGPADTLVRQIRTATHACLPRAPH